MPRFALIALCVVLALGGGIQAVPYGRRHENPSVLAEPKVSSCGRDTEVAIRFLLAVIVPSSSSRGRSTLRLW